MRVFVVGSTGVLGRHLIPLLLSQGHQVRTFARTPEKLARLQQEGVEALPGDILTEETAALLPTLLDGCEAVVHAATAIPANFAAPDAWTQTGKLRTQGTLVLLQAALQAGIHVYIQQSITMVYADGGNRWLDEQTPFDASPARAAINGPVQIMENLLRSTPAHLLRWCILRGSFFTGRGKAQDALLTSLRTGKATVPCNGNFYRSFVHPTDMALAISCALSHAPASSTFNIAAEPVLYGTYIDHLAMLLKAPAPPRQNEENCPVSQRVSSASARTILGWSPQHDIYEDVS